MVNRSFKQLICFLTLSADVASEFKVKEFKVKMPQNITKVSLKIHLLVVC